MKPTSKDQIIQRHKKNSHLNKPLFPTTTDSPKNLCVDQPSEEISPSVVNKVSEALRNGKTHYADVSGIDQLRKLLANYLNDSYATEYGYEQVLVTAGIQEARFLTIQKIGSEFDTIAIPEVTHPGVRRALGVRPIDTITLATERTRGFLPSIVSIRNGLEQGAELIYLESPSRFTGATFETAAVEQIAELLREYDVGAIWDQGQAVWVPEGTYMSLASQKEKAEQVTVIGEAWPGKGLESWQVGYIGTAKSAWFNSMKSQKQIMSICTNTPSQYAAHEIGKQFAETHPPQRKQLLGSKTEVVAQAQKTGVQLLPGDTANLVALSFPPVLRDQWDDADIGFADGTAFGAPEAIRVVVTSDDTTKNAISKLK